MIEPLRAPITRPTRLAEALGIDLLMQRDDLLAFPLASSKVRALTAELAAAPAGITDFVSNGSVDSNHCRTLAMMCAERGVACRLVLHGNPGSFAARRVAAMYDHLGASITIVHPAEIAAAIARNEAVVRSSGGVPHVIPGGCHSPAASIAYRDAAAAVLNVARPDVVLVASGTGAIQGGLAAAAERAAATCRVIGISVARQRQRGVAAVAEAAAWAGAADSDIDFRDAYLDGGYGRCGEATERAVQLAWRHGIPVDPTYSGKAFAALLDLSRHELAGARILFWHTGGLFNYLQREPR